MISLDTQPSSIVGQATNNDRELPAAQVSDTFVAMLFSTGYTKV